MKCCFIYRFLYLRDLKHTIDSVKGKYDVNEYIQLTHLFKHKTHNSDGRHSWWLWDKDYWKVANQWPINHQQVANQSWTHWGRDKITAISQTTFSNTFSWMKTLVWIKMSLTFVPKGPINNIPALVQIIAWRLPGDKPLSKPIVVSLLMHICVTRPQWVKHFLIIYKRFSSAATNRFPTD